MDRKEKRAIEQQNARRLIFEMMDAAVEFSVKKGPHPLEKGCNCIACVNKRKEMSRENPPVWKHHL